ncbi:CRISPR system Cascade subunit CasE [Murinocardiopsis flavida]|uniref:CRISPR system Cascade subunit CasE n=1 Tax=Murinocardiopsis flavida TaxID=645275 RepID=A0A2P8DUX1_9ACTN|nr:CRISPR system Cascade subunit CasE [Murinocardiopsis flavida]
MLWRVDDNAKSEVFLYLVSPAAPDLTHLEEQAGWPTTPTWRTFEYDTFLSKLAKGDVWGFRLTANPVHSIRRKDGEPTKVTAHITPRHQMGWLLQRQDAAGFRIVEKPHGQRRLPDGDDLELIVRDRRDRAFEKTDKADRSDGSEGSDRPDGSARTAETGGARGRKNRVTLVTATFDGRLEVTDPAALRRTLTAGLGRAKAYGCGLMTLAPVE